MSALAKAKELLAEIESQIANAERSLKDLRARKREISRLLGLLSGRPGRGRPRGRRGRPRLKRKAGRRKASRTRTDWTRLIGRIRSPFTVDDLAKASKKQKGTVHQALLKLKKAGKIAPTGKRGEYKRG